MANLYKCVLGVSILSISFFCSCKKNEVKAISGEGKIRSVNAVIGSNPQFFYCNDLKVSVNPMAYGEFNTDYYKVPVGAINISFRNSLNGEVTVSANGGINPGTAYTAFYYASTNGKGMITVLEDNNVVPASNKIKVRFLSLSNVFNNTINVNLSNGTALVTGLSYYKYTDYYNVDFGTALEVLVNGAVVKTSIPSTSFQAGKIYTVWFDAVNPTECKYHIVVQN